MVQELARLEEQRPAAVEAVGGHAGGLGRDVHEPRGPPVPRRPRWRSDKKHVHGRASAARIAATSAVRSMPTGHQVMQRPQPVQPEVPNWSIQPASLCVSHWR